MENFPHSPALENIPVGTILPCVAGASIPPSQRLHLILLGVRDVAESAAFYESLGWIRSPTGHAGFVKFNLNGYALCLLPYDDLAKDALVERSAPCGQFNGIALVHLAKTVHDVALILERAVMAGGTLVKPATRTLWGVAGYFKDPDGYLLEVDYERTWMFDHEGGLIVDPLTTQASAAMA